MKRVCFLEETLLDNIAATNDGTWIAVDGLPFSVHIKGTFTATVEVRVSNDPTKPSDSVNDELVGSVSNSSGIITLSNPVKWVKARVSAYTSGTINAYLVGG